MEKNKTGNWVFELIKLKKVWKLHKNRKYFTKVLDEKMKNEVKKKMKKMN